MPGLLRAQRGLRPGVAPDPGGEGRRPLRRQRPEGVDVARPHRGLHDAAGPHRSERAQAQGHHLLPARHEEPRRHREAAQADDRRRGVQRGLLRQRPRARIADPGWSRQRLGGRPHHPDVRAARARLRPAGSPAHRARQPGRHGARHQEERSAGDPGPGDAPEAGPDVDRHRGVQVHRGARDHQALEGRAARPRGLRGQDDVGGGPPARAGAGDGDPGRVRAAHPRQRVGGGGRPPRSSATSSASACSASRKAKP